MSLGTLSEHPAWPKITTIRIPILAPFMLMMIALAVFQSRQTLWDLFALPAMVVLAQMVQPPQSFDLGRR